MLTQIMEINMDSIPDYAASENPIGKLLTTQNWLPYWQLDTVYDISTLGGVTDVSQRDANEIERICDTIDEQSADPKAQLLALKAELLNFVKGRRDLVEAIYEKWDSPDCEKWGFPSPNLKPE
jgi:hypothetical protein